MLPRTTTNSVVRQLRLVFSLSTLLLLISLAASFFSIQRLIRNSELVNHTNEVLQHSEGIISAMKDAETGQRGYLITLDRQFLQPYNTSYERVMDSFGRVRELTRDNAIQQSNLDQAKVLIEDKYAQMRRTIDLTDQNPAFGVDQIARNREMTKGKEIMDRLRAVVNRMKAEENRLLQERIQTQEFYITYTPFLLALAAFVSMLITTLAYFRIKKDVDDRIKQQEDAANQYQETARRIAALEDVTGQIADGNYAVRSPDEQPDDLGRISAALNRMAASLEQTFTDITTSNWLQTGSVSIRDAIRGQNDLQQLGNQLIDAIATYLQAPLGTVYLMDPDGTFKLSGSFAATNPPASIQPGQGLIGQAIDQQKMVIVRDVPPDYSRVRSSLGDTQPTALLIAPLVQGNVCIGAIELGLLHSPEPHEVMFIERNIEPLTISVNAALDYVRLQNLLEETQTQAEELQVQQEELENLNAELEMQAQKLQASEEELRVQQEELQQTNTELEERGLLLEERNNEIQQKADELEVATRYKSEFLANMSHELRTPLNSILLLSRLLAENGEENLNDEQVEYANVIQSAGNGLLGLIDEILDLSKIEAGQMKLDIQQLSVRDLTDELQGLFGVMAKEKGLDFTIMVSSDVPTLIETDRMRLGQILKNLLSNALKFTANGSVTLTISPAYSGTPTRQKSLAEVSKLSFVVQDTGIGIPPEKQPLIFEAFQQADGSTKRQYGGTGLGLSISRELARLLGGEITLSSQVGEGSTFTVILPIAGLKPTEAPTLSIDMSQSEGAAPPTSEKPALRLQSKEAEVSVVNGSSLEDGTGNQPPQVYRSSVIPEAIPDDRDSVQPGDKVILIVEDDTNFARSLLKFARKKGYKCIIAVRGDEGLQLAKTFKPIGVLLDIQLPIMSGWEVMDALKADPVTRPIPVHIMSSHKVKIESRLKGAIDFVDKPMAFEQMQDVFQKIEYVLNRQSKKVLIIEDNSKHAKALAYFLETFNINSELKSDVTEGIDALKQQEVDCVILDMGVPDSKAYETLEAARKDPDFENLPIIIFTGKSLSMNEELKIRKYADSIIVKTAHSYQRMLDEVSLFLHIVEENKQANQKTSSPRKLGALNQVLANKTVLVADDDVRNIFSLTKALEKYNMTVVAALDGQEALDRLAENPKIDVVLLDMMMPNLDGYEAARKIRENPTWKNLPVIAVTAKAMTGDREKCIQAGASDYITKPVDVDQLISLLRVWLYE